jgi:hypothetical protein
MSSEKNEPRPLDYESPAPDELPRPSPGCLGGCLGGLLGGVAIPLSAMWYCDVVLNDMGGILFWPIVAFGLGLAGMIIGALCGSLAQRIARSK